MKLEVGMYCRYNNFQNKIKIAKIKGIQKADEVFKYNYINFDNDDGELETNIIKASYNIIDILEEGDYVNGQEVYYDEELDFLYVQSFDADGEFYQENIAKQSFIDNIKSVITHEQMEQMAYKVGE